MSGLTIVLLKDSGARVTVDRRLFLNAAKTKVVEEGDPDAAFLFAAAGKNVLKADLKQLGYQFITKADRAKAEKAKAKKAEAKKAADAKAEEEAAAAKAEEEAAAAKKAETTKSKK